MPSTELNVCRRGAGFRACVVRALLRRADLRGGAAASWHLGPRLAPLALLLALAAPVPATAALHWESKEQSIALRATESTGTVRFAFTNAGAKPVTITDVHPGCGCTVPALAKNVYEPGEHGVLTVDFHPGSREGTVRMPITVQTDDDGETATLTLVAQIETIVSFDTRFVFWKGNEPRTPKLMRLTFAQSLTAALAGVQCSSPEFSATFRPVGDSGREYEITVTPPAEIQTYTAITLRTLLGTEKNERLFTVVARTMDGPAPVTAAAVAAPSGHSQGRK